MKGQLILINEYASLSLEDTFKLSWKIFENSVPSEIFSKTIYLMNELLYGTPLKIIKNGEYVSSIAINNFLDKNKPLLFNYSFMDIFMNQFFNCNHYYIYGFMENNIPIINIYHLLDYNVIYFNLKIIRNQNVLLKLIMKINNNKKFNNNHNI
ncbi:hypothetical protein U3516DRAFT_667049 [Neocallimastix sp. 'constans']